MYRLLLPIRTLELTLRAWLWLSSKLHEAKSN